MSIVPLRFGFVVKLLYRRNDAFSILLYPLILQRNQFNLLKTAGLILTPSGFGEYRIFNNRMIQENTYILNIAYGDFCIAVWINSEKSELSYRASLTKEGEILRHVLQLYPDLNMVRSIAGKYHKSFGDKTTVHRLSDTPQGLTFNYNQLLASFDGGVK